MTENQSRVSPRFFFLFLVYRFPKKEHCGRAKMKRECEGGGKPIPAWPTRTNKRPRKKCAHLGWTFGPSPSKAERERKWAWRGHGRQLDVTARRPTAQSLKKAHRKLEEKKKKIKKPLPERTVDVMKPTPLCNARGITTDYWATHAGEGHHSKDNSLSHTAIPGAFTHQLAGTVWIVVIVVVTISIPQSSPSRQEKKGKHHLYVYFPPFP